MLINFLPHRKWNLARKRKKFATSLAVAAFLGLVLGAGSSVWIGWQLTAQNSDNSLLKNEISALDKVLKKMTLLDADIVRLNLRGTTLQTLRNEGKRSAVWLQEVAANLPDGLYLTAIKQDGDKVSIQGVARTNEQVFDFLNRISLESQWLAQAELIEVTSAALSKDDLALMGMTFAMRALLKHIKQPVDFDVSQHPSGAR